jgi:hypothetical protein
MRLGSFSSGKVKSIGVTLAYDWFSKSSGSGIALARLEAFGLEASVALG